MSKLWIGNFSFENELQGRNSPSAAIRRFQAELVPCLAAATEPGDIIRCPENIEEAYLEHLNSYGLSSLQFLHAKEALNQASEIQEVEPWGWSRAVHDSIKSLGEFQYPPLESVYLANSRKLSFELSLELGGQILGECKICDLSQMVERLQTEFYRTGFVVKSNFGQSGRGQFVSVINRLNEKSKNWIQRKLQTDGFLFLEPKLTPVAEFGIQWDIPVEGPPTLFGATMLRSDSRGQYAGSIVNFDQQDTPEMEEIIAIQSKAILNIQSLGYFGPVGIDAMIYLDSNKQRRIRPLQDINARWTMGRLAIYWANRLYSEKSNICWSHSFERPSSSAIRTSPEFVGGRPVRYQTWCYQNESENV